MEQSFNQIKITCSEPNCAFIGNSKWMYIHNFYNHPTVSSIKQILNKSSQLDEARLNFPNGIKLLLEFKYSK